jgi:hypothetical protein
MSTSLHRVLNNHTCYNHLIAIEEFHLVVPTRFPLPLQQLKPSMRLGALECLPKMLD